jgi:hypothetical protein
MKRFRIKILSFAIIIAFMAILCMTGVGSAVVYHQNEVISTDTIWAADVHVINGFVTVNDDVKLSIQAGAVVKFNSGAYMSVVGTLKAVGTASNKIIFTSLNASPSPSDWDDIRFVGDAEMDGRGIAVDSSGYVYVADPLNDRIQKFDSDDTKEEGGTENGM